MTCVDKTNEKGGADAAMLILSHAFTLSYWKIIIIQQNMGWVNDFFFKLQHNASDTNIL